MKPTIALISAPLCLAVALMSTAPAGARKSTGSSSQKNPDSGRQLYMRNCTRCHGDEGKGKNGPRLAGESLSRDEIEKKVTGGGTEMPSFKKQLSPAEVKAVSAFVQSLGGGS